MLALIATERIKLFSTRAAWWYLAITAVSVLGLAAVQAAFPLDNVQPRLSDVLVGSLLGQILLMTMAVGSVTAEHRFGTIRVSYLAVANRWPLLAAKTVTLAAIAFGAGTLIAVLSLVIGNAVAPDAGLLPLDAAGWRVLLGVGPVYAVSAVFAVTVALLIRNSAGAIALLLVWLLLLETSTAFIPAGDKIGPLLPFQAMSYFLDQGGSNFPYPAWFGIVYAATLALVLCGLAIAAASRRDAAA